MDVDGRNCSLQRCLERPKTCLLSVEKLLFDSVMGKDPNWKMEYRLGLMLLLVLLTPASSVALSREEFSEAVVRKCRTC